MRTVTKSVFSYSELSEEAKSKAREWYREASIRDDFFAECVIEDAADIADIMGIDLRQTRKTRMDKTTFYAPSISYSGFYSQGDGASFEASYKYKKGAMKALKAYAPKDEKLHAICKVLQEAQRKVFYSATVSVTTSGRYCHSGSMSFDIEIGKNETQKNMSDFESTGCEALKDFADWIYRMLESEYDYQNSDEAVEESIEANEYEFTEEGEIY